MTDHVARRVSQEGEGVATRPVARIAAGAIVVAAGAVAATGWLVSRDVGAREGRSAVAVGPRELGVVEQTLLERAADGLVQERRARADLDTYGWVDRRRGIARLPIDEAIELFVSAEAARKDAGGE